jgi:hypothetical protein
MLTVTYRKVKTELDRYQKKLVSLVEYHFITKQLNTTLGYGFFVGIAILVTGVGIKLGIIGSLLLLVFCLAVATLLVCLLHPTIALFLSIVFSFFIIYFYRGLLVYYPHLAEAIPIGAAVDIMLVVGLMAVLLDQSYQGRRSFAFTKNPITYVYVLYLLFLVVELFNPNMNVPLGYISFTRRIITLLACYVVVLYVFDSRYFLKNFIKLWLGLALLAALYGCSQKWFGYLPMEEYWISLATVVEGKRPYLHDGIIRHFSFFSDPTVFGMFMAISGLFCLVLLTGPFQTVTKVKITVVAVFVFLGLAYSGTRTAYAMIPAGLVLFGLMTITKRSTLVLATVAAVVFGFILFGPIYSNPTINRIRTAFKGSEDASLNLRNIKRHIVQPLMFEHPLGGGVETSGVIGSKYDPSHYLAKYVIDSGYVKIAIETGIIGLLITMACYFTVMYVGVSQYYKSNNAEFRTYIAGMVVVVYSLIIYTYAQKSINQFPAGLILYSIFAILAKVDIIEQHHHNPHTVEE